MARYIDMDKIFPNGVFYVCENNPMASLDELINRICNTPTADVVEVVHCKDCKHNKYEQPNGIIHCHRDRKEGWIFRKTTDYCSYGERE